MHLIFFISVIFAFQAPALTQTTWYVDAGNVSGPWTGTQLNPFKEIGDGINAASNSDKVLVAQGTYVENIDFSGKGITVESEAGPGETWIDGSQLGSVVAFISGETSSSILRGFTLTNGYHTAGGGIRCERASPVIEGNLIRLNGSTLYGGGIHLTESAAMIRNNTISENVTVQYYGAGVYCGRSSLPTIHSNVITHNWAGSLGGGIFCRRSSALIINNIIAHNTVPDHGAGIYCKLDMAAPSVLVNNTICYNSAGQIGGGIYCYTNSSPVVINTILWGNDAPQGLQLFAESGSQPVVTWCDIQDGWPGTGNIESDPLFVDPANGDFHLTFNSPCRASGDSSAITEPYDFEGDPRIAHGTVDMGADEFYTHLYVTGDKTPSGVIQGKFVGLPGTNPVGLFVGSGILPTPINTMWGAFWLQAPWLVFTLYPIPGNGILELPTTLPGTIPAPYDIPMQALIGLNPDSLTNLCVLEVR